MGDHTADPTSPALIDRLAAAPRLPPDADAEAFPRLLIEHADADTALALAAALVRPSVRALIAGAAAHAPFLARLMRRDPGRLLAILEDVPEARVIRLAEGLAESARAAPGLEAAMVPLRRARADVALTVALADLGGVWSVDAVVAALTRFADAACAAATASALARAAERGRLAIPDPFERPEAAGLVLLAMGKHGAGELNYSSDIDLIALFDPQRSVVPAAGEPVETFARVIRDVVRLLNETTPDGYVFRVDLRLRPDPASTPVALPIPAAMHYYETVGQNWERAAMIKARPVAGDLGLGASFLADLRPFIWRKYFDYAAIADIQAMKRQIYVHKGHETVAIEGHDLKLGRGGIREIEFFVQTQQLIFGGKRPVLRGRGTLAMLDALAEQGWIDGGAAQELAVAYRHLRSLEHRLQMLNDEQTQRLPGTGEAIDRFALFCGAAPSAFRAHLAQTLLTVERHYARLFEEAPELSAAAGSLVFTGTSDDPETLRTLKTLGFARPELVAETVRGWHFGRRRAIISQRAREVLTDLVPALLEALGRSTDPDAGLIALDRALGSMPAVVELFTLLRQNAALRGLFAEILGSAPVLADVVTRRPHVLDALLDPEFAAPIPPEAVRRRIVERLAPIERLDDLLDEARDLGRAERFLVGARVLSGLVAPEEAGQAYAAIAEGFLEVAVARGHAALAPRHGAVPGGRFAVLALGKLGGRELNHASDLDLVMIFDSPQGAGSDGDRPLDPAEYYGRLTQRIVSVLASPTPRGTLYDVDLRLRPFGSKGPLAVSLRRFREYHEAEAETWERMALTRARPVAGDPGLGMAVMDAVAEALRQRRPWRETAAAIRAMRALVAKEKPPRGPLDVKLAPGGLVDIEFAAQALVLREPSLLSPQTGTVLVNARESGLLPPGLADDLLEAWRLQSALAALLALMTPEGDAAVASPRLAQSLGLPDNKVLMATLVERQGAAHAAHRTVLADGQG